jgi:hypothetical protein
MKLATALVLFAACSTTEDRPETLAFITETILAPSCGTTECHSSMVMRQGYAFDTVAAAQVSLAKNLIATCDIPPCDQAPANSYLLTVITDKDSFGDRMPLDQALPNKDMVLIAKWITDGAEGYTPP